jgi:transcriptional regulator with XRE-family HTH domain
MPSKKSAANRKLARAIRSRREQRGYTQESAARHIGIDRSYYGAIERGEFNVTLDTLVKIGDGLGASVAELCGRADV